MMILLKIYSGLIKLNISKYKEEAHMVILNKKKESSIYSDVTFKKCCPGCRAPTCPGYLCCGPAGR
jgi:hypothetical protein